jgi:hypothetical protein
MNPSRYRAGQIWIGSAKQNQRERILFLHPESHEVRLALTRERLSDTPYWGGFDDTKCLKWVIRYGDTRHYQVMEWLVAHATFQPGDVTGLLPDRPQTLLYCPSWESNAASP